MNYRSSLLTAALLLGVVCALQGGVYHVAPSGSDANSGSSLTSPWLTIGRANKAAVAGDLIIVHGGQYTDGIAPVNNGAPGSPITFQVAAGERAVLTAATGVQIGSGHHDIVVDGFEIHATYRVVDLHGASYITVRNCTCYGGRETYQAFDLLDCSYCVIQNNYLDRQDPDAASGGGDGLVAQGHSNHNLIEGNTVTRCEHMGLASPYSGQSYNIWRNNKAYNNHTNFGLYDGVERSVFEGNTGYYQGLVWTGGSGNCLQFTGTNCIIRFNTLYDDTATTHTDRIWWSIVGAGSGSANALTPSVQYNKIYNNTIYGESDQTQWKKSGWRTDNYSTAMAQNNNNFKNNIFAAAPDAQVEDIDDVRPASSANNRYEGNLLYASGGAPATIVYFFSGGNDRLTLSQAKAGRPNQWAASNVEGNPLFVNSVGQGPAKDFSLGTGSPAIDAGVHLATALNGGTGGTTLKVDDPNYFCDGWGIPGVVGDSIKIEGSAPVGLAAVDYNSGTMTLNAPRDWAQGARVYYYRSDRFQGNAPDIGSHESGSSATPPPPPPPPPSSPPSAPVLASPPNGSGDVASGVTLVWKASANAVSYLIQVCHDGSFSTLDYSASTAAQNLALSSLSPGTTYYWRVNATSSGGTSQWSEVWTLTTLVPGSQGTASNLLSDPGFESSLDSWYSYCNGQANFTISSPGFNSAHAAKFHIANAGDNIQVYQYNIPLAPNTTYLLSFAAYSSSGHDLELSVGKHESPYTNYGLKGSRFDLDTTWKTYTVVFTTTNFTSPVSDARLLLWLAPYAVSGDDYYVDNFVLSPASSMPAAPIAVAPPPGAVSQPTSITLKWLRRQEVSAYDIEVALDSNFARRVASDTAVVDTQYHLASLGNLTTYYWHVRSRSNGVPGLFNGAQSFTTLASPLSTPVWTSSADSIRPVSFVVSWGPVTGATRYRLQLATDSQFRAIVLDDTTLTETSRSIGPLDYGTQYFLRVQATGTGGTSSFSVPLQFMTIVQVPGVPAFTQAPSGNSMVPVEFTVSWARVQGATLYHLQVASDSAFRILQYDDAAITDTVRRIGPLQQGSTYFMHLCALNTGGSSNYSPFVQFTTSSAQLAVPFLVSSSGPSSNWPLQSTLRWLPVPGAVRYHLQLATDSRFSILVIDDSTLTDTVAHIGPLSYATSYFVRMRAMNNQTASVFSAPFPFSTIQAPPAAPPGLVLASVPQTTKAVLSWKSVYGATWYHLQVSADSLFGVFAVDDSMVTDTTKTVTSLNPATRYFARVRAGGTGGTSDFSPLFSFVTASSAPVVSLPREYFLEQNYPNPFNPVTVVSSQLPVASNVRITIFDMLGREVAVLVNERREAGVYKDTFDGSGRASGMYICRLTAGSYVQSRQILLLK